MKQVYLCVGTDILHTGHINIIERAAALGELTVGVLTDEVIASYRRFPLLPLEERCRLLQGLKGVKATVVQRSLDYSDILDELRPDIVVHGDNWRAGYQAGIRQKVIDKLREWGGELIEFPYTHSETEALLEAAAREKLAMPEARRARLRRMLALKKPLAVIEAHSGLTGLLAEKLRYESDGGEVRQFDAMWLSSLCDSTARGKPDIELVDLSARIRTIEDIMEVTTKPIIVDGDTGGLIEHFQHNIRTLERIGVSAVIIEDKIGLKRNSLFGTEVEQQQDSIEGFCDKIRAGKAVLRTPDFMLIARIESLILDRGVDDALARAFAYVAAGADGIMIHSRQKSPDEIFAFCRAFRARDRATPIVVVPTTFNAVTEPEFAAEGVDIVIYANQLTRSAFPAMRQAALNILEHQRAKEADDACMPIKDIITLIPE